MPDEAMTQEEIDALRAERNRLIEERDSERRRADAESQRAETLHGQVMTGSRQLAESAVQGIDAQAQRAEGEISAIGTELTGLKSQYSTLLAEGKFDEAADVQEKISDAAARRNQAQQARTYYTQQREQAKAIPADPVDRFFQANPQFTRVEQDWIRRNPRFATDRGFMDRVTAAHAAVVAKNIAPQSPEYFQELEQAGYMRTALQADPAQARQPSPHFAPPDDNGDLEDPYSGGAVEIVEEPAVLQPPQRPVARGPAAAAPTRRAPTAPAPRQQVLARLTPEQADTALKNADLAPIEIQNQGDAAILAWWAELNQSQAATRIRSEWA